MYTCMHKLYTCVCVPSLAMLTLLPPLLSCGLCWVCKCRWTKTLVKLLLTYQLPVSGTEGTGRDTAEGGEVNCLSVSTAQARNTIHRNLSVLSDSNCFTDNKRHVWWLAFWTALALNALARGEGQQRRGGAAGAAANSSSLALTICRFWFALVIWIWMAQDLRLSVAAREREGGESVNVLWVWCECVSECQCELECECECVSVCMWMGMKAYAIRLAAWLYCCHIKCWVKFMLTLRNICQSRPATPPALSPGCVHVCLPVVGRAHLIW